MRTKATLFLLVLVLSLGGLAYYLNQQWNAHRGFIANRTSVLGSDAVDLDFLRIEFTDNSTPIVLEKHGSGWDLIEPVRWPANYFAVNRLLSQLQNLERETSFPASHGSNGQTLADYGLEPPRGRLTYGRHGENSILEVGRETDVGNRLYVMPEDGDRVYVVNRALLDSLRLPIEQFRSSAVFTLPLFEVRSWNVQIAEAGNLRVWVSREGEKWNLETPVRARADKAAVETLVNRLLGIRVARFETGSTDLNVLGLTTPSFIVAFEGSGRREALLIGNAVPGQADTPTLYYAKREDNPTVFTIDVDFLGDLKNAQVGLRDRRLLEFDSNQLQSISIQPANRPTIHLQKLESGQWQVLTRPSESGLPMPADDARVEEIIHDLADLRAVSSERGTSGFVTDAPSAEQLANTYYLASPAWRIVVTERTDGPSTQLRELTLLLGGPDFPGSNHNYAKLGQAPSVFLVDRGLADDLSAEPESYRDRNLQQLPEGARIVSVTIKRLASDSPQVSVALANPEQPWAESLAEVDSPRREALLDLIAQLRNLRASQIVSTHFSSTVPNEPGEKPWTWLLEAMINLEGGAVRQSSNFRLYLDSYTGGSRLLAATPELDLVFEADQSFIDAFGPLVFQRVDPGPPDPDEMRRPTATTTTESAPGTPDVAAPPPTESTPAPTP